MSQLHKILTYVPNKWITYFLTTYTTVRIKTLFSSFNLETKESVGLSTLEKGVVQWFTAGSSVQSFIKKNEYKLFLKIYK